jgi:hypothetical protein
MNEDLAAFGRALETFLKIFRRDVNEIIDKGALPCPPGLEKALKEVVYKWAAERYTEFTVVDELPIFKQ